jgi:prophage regulatory protein
MSLPTQKRLLRLAAVLERIPLSRSEIYRRIDKNEFPQRIKLGARTIAFDADEIDAYIAALIASADSKAKIQAESKTVIAPTMVAGQAQ